MAVTTDHASIVSEVYRLVQGFIQEYISLMLGLLISVSRNTVTMFTTLYIVILGYLILSQKITLDFKNTMQILASMAILIFVTSLFYSPAIYANYFINPTIELTLDLANFFINFGLGDSLEGVFKNLGDLLARVFILCGILWKATSISEPGTYVEAFFAIFIVGIPIILSVGLYVFVLLISILNIYILFAVGCFYLYLAAFAATRSHFSAWVKTILVQVMLVLVSSIVIAISSFCINKVMMKVYVADFDTSLFNAAFLSTAFVSWLCFFALMKAPELVSNLTSAQGGSNSGIVMGMAAVGALGAKSIGGMKNQLLTKGSALRKGASEGMSTASSLFSKLRGGVKP